MASHMIRVTHLQVSAARLRLSIDRQLGRDSSPAVVRIAGARRRSSAQPGGHPAPPASAEDD
ncbi:MAG: hypothetical protein M3042_03675 [Actinomycetota bacterium]|nr:hypothetical protein [Actinomycetota bacterium]